MSATAHRFFTSFSNFSSQTAIPVFSGLVTTLLSAILAAIASRIVQPELPLWYTAIQPAATLAERNWLLLIPILSLVLEIIMIMCVLLVKKIESVVLQLFAWTIVVSQVLLLLALLRIVFLIT